MPSYRLDTLIKLETKLSALRAHYALCPDLEVKDVLEWAGFFLKWSQEAMENSGDWGKKNFLAADRLAIDIAKSKSASNSAVALAVAMADAAKGLEAEIMTFSMPVAELRRV